MANRKTYKVLMLIVFMNINKIINANGLLRRCMETTSGKEVSMADAYKTRILFDKYVGGEVSDEECAEKVTEFIHRGGLGGTTYKDATSMEDNSPFSADVVFENVKNGAPKTGHCIGTSLVAGYLLASRGMEVRTLSSSNHVLLDVNIDGKWVPLETTSVHGYGIRNRDGFEVNEMGKLESSVLYSQGCVFDWKGERDLAIENYTKILKKDNRDVSAYSNRGSSRMNEGKYDLAIKDCTKAIELDPEHDTAYLTRGACRRGNKEYVLALEDFEKYGSFGGKNKATATIAIGSVQKML